MIVKVHEKSGGILVAVCDSELIGKKLAEGDAQIDLSADFYHGVEKSAEETGDLIRNADYINLVGQQSVALGIKEGIIDEEKVILIEHIPHAQGAIIRD